MTPCSNQSIIIIVVFITPTQASGSLSEVYYYSTSSTVEYLVLEYLGTVLVLQVSTYLGPESPLGADSEKIIGIDQWSSPVHASWSPVPANSARAAASE